MDTSLGIIDRLDAQLRLNLDNQHRLIERREALANRPVLTPSIPDDRSGSTADSPARHPESPAETLARMQQQLRQLRVRYTDQHPDVVRLRGGIADLEKELADSPPPAPAAASGGRTNLGPGRQPEDELSAELRALKAEEKRLRDAIATYVTRVQNTPKLEQELKELSRDYESTKELYASLSKRYEEAELAESMEQRQKGEQFRILDPALPSAVPAAPHRVRLMAFAVMVSLGLAVGAVVLAEELDTSFHNRESLRGFTRVPVFGLPRIVLETDVRQRRWRFRLAATGTALGLFLIVAISYFFAHGNERLLRW
jgi:uncharacterized protein involved in exopolysaccharide biosynthesis